MEYSIFTKEAAPQPILIVRRRVRPAEMADALAQMFHEVFLFAQRKGAALAGQPLTRYVEWGPGLLTIEAGLPVTEPFSGDIKDGAAVQAGTLPGGLVATTVHNGLYDKLTEAHAALQVWIEEQGLVPRAPLWESYVTDPAHYPDPSDWRTELFWPVEPGRSANG